MAFEKCPQEVEDSGSCQGLQRGSGKMLTHSCPQPGRVRGSEACGAGHAVLSDTQNIPVPISFPNPQRQTMSSVSQKTQDNSVPPRKSLERTEEDRSFPPAADKPAKSPVINRENHTRAFLQCQRTPASLSISQTQRWRTRLQQSPTRCASEYLDLKLDFTVIDILRKHFGETSFKDPNES